jgi:hypothetical protein
MGRSPVHALNDSVDLVIISRSQLICILPAGCTARTWPKAGANGYSCCVATCYYAFTAALWGTKGLPCSAAHLIMDLSWTLLESMSHRLATKKSWYFFLVILVLLINLLVEVCVIQQLYNFLQLLWFLSLPHYIVFVLIFTVVKVFHVHQCVHFFPQLSNGCLRFWGHIHWGIYSHFHLGGIDFFAGSDLDRLMMTSSLDWSWKMVEEGVLQVWWIWSLCSPLFVQSSLHCVQAITVMKTPSDEDTFTVHD